MSNNEIKKSLIVLTGPTAVGKTSLSIKLAKKINGEIISADSMQVYRKMNIGSAKITPDEMDGVKHHLIDILEPTQEYSAAKFKEHALEAINEITANKHIPIIVGGTGFYIQSVLYDIDFSDEAQTEYKKELEELLIQKGPEYLHNMLRDCDELSANRIHSNDSKRVIRALEYFNSTGQSISIHNEEERAKESPYNFKYIVLNQPREILYKNIDMRVDKMIADGLVDEVSSLKELGCNKTMVAMKGLGYKEILDYLDGDISLDEAIRIIKRDTRHFAKRQLTWFKREKEVTFVNKEEFDYDEELILEHIMNLVGDVI